jgi:hypothetical protein
VPVLILLVRAALRMRGASALTSPTPTACRPCAGRADPRP